MSTLKMHPAKPVHLAARNAMLEALYGFAEMTAVEMLAVTAQLVGNLIAYQDQRAMSPDQAMELVTQNILAGNALAIHETLGAPRGNA